MNSNSGTKSFGEFIMLLALLLSLYTLASPSDLFVYLKRRYDEPVIRELNLALRLKGKCTRVQENIRFLNKCLTWYVTPTRIRQRVRAVRPKTPVGIERNELDSVFD